jgi:hypothetical protein
MLENWAKLSGFAAILAAVMAVSFLWALGYVPPQNADWTCEGKADPNQPNKPALTTFTCHTQQPDNLNTQTARTEKQSRQDVSNDVKITDILLALFTGMLVVVTAVLIAVGISQSSQLKRAVDASKDEFSSTHRPKIRVKHVWLAADVWHGEPIIINLVCVNTGTVDARLHEIGVRYEIVRDGAMLPVNPDIPAALRVGGQFRLRSGLNHRFPNINVGRILTQAENVEIQNKGSRLFCIGYISYLDADNRMRITGFCRVLEFPHNATARADNARFTIHKDPDYEYKD